MHKTGWLDIWKLKMGQGPSKYATTENLILPVANLTANGEQIYIGLSPIYR